MKLQKCRILGVEGNFYQGEVPDTICFVPFSLIISGKLDEANYVLLGWASLNLKAQPLERRLGSHLFPDLKKPIVDLSRCEAIREEIERLRPQTPQAAVAA
ncbi:MAG TPA: hypothetical protein VEC99_14070 [Clostridia bacterium]|nr:hypothetical protein [Clostridia bacterium]